MKPTAAFVRLWLATDTMIYGMKLNQFKKVRQLCELFYEAGKKHKEIQNDQTDPRRHNARKFTA